MAIEFLTAGNPRVVSLAIEEFATSDGHVAALVVPWESQGATLNMAVTSVKSDGWAIEHTNLGTITLSDRGGEITAVTFSAEPPDRVGNPQLRALFDRFGERLHAKFAMSR